MKKFLFFIAVAALPLLSKAGDAEKMQAFKHLGIGIETGLMGGAVNLYMPIVTNHLVLNVGYHLPSIKISNEFDVNVSSVNGDILMINDKINELRSVASGYGIPVNLNKINALNGVVDANAKLNFTNFKIMLEYYPSIKSNFHFTFGAMIGNDRFIEIEGHTSKNDWDTYKNVASGIKHTNDIISSINATAGQSIVSPLDITSSELTFDFDEKTYRVEDLDGDGTGDVKGAVIINKVKPYFGIGFGRSIPNKRISFQFEFGAWYHGTPELNIDNPNSSNAGLINDDDTLRDIINKTKDISFWPQVTFRLIGRLF